MTSAANEHPSTHLRPREAPALVSVLELLAGRHGTRKLALMTLARIRPLKDRAAATGVPEVAMCARGDFFQPCHSQRQG